MPSRERLAAVGAVAAGFTMVMVVPNLLAGSLSRAGLLALSLVGGGVAFGGALYDDARCRARRDERQAEIHYRAGYNAMLAMGAAFGTLFLVMVNLDTAVEPLVVWALLMGALPVYFGSVAWYRRRM